MYIHERNVHNTTAASQVVPLIIEHFKPKSILDVGCGIGTWLSVFKENGVQDVTGIDGEYVDRHLLKEHVNLQHFIPKDLSKSFNLERKFDLVISFEVAEHLPASSARIFVQSLCRHSETILFSAAIPHQGGQNHLNEQWPAYWMELFKDAGYDCYDGFRKLIWDNKEVDWWYKQNIFLFSKLQYPAFYKAQKMMSVTHPDNYLQKVEAIKHLQDQNYYLQNSLSDVTEGRTGMKTALVAFKKAILNKIKSY